MPKTLLHGCRIKLVLIALVTFQLSVFVFICVPVIRQEWNNRADADAPVQDNDTLSSFLQEYEQFCENNVIPQPRNFVDLNDMQNRKLINVCPCIPDTLIGQHNSTFDPPSFGELELMHTELTMGGSWHPENCIARQRVAIIIPFRDREQHLRMLLSILHPMLQRQMLHYTIFIVEQLEPAVFNKASLMNVGFIEARAYADFDCFIFHDVDMLPEDDHNFYVCTLDPRHVGSHIAKWDYKVPYPEIFGGVTAFTREHFEKVNGFSNQYYGWGGEDDDMYSRIKAQNLSIVRFSKTVARYTMIKHTADAGNPYNTKSNVAWKFRPEHYVHDGLNSLRYWLVATEARPLYTWLLVRVPPHPPYFRGTYRGISAASRGCFMCTPVVWTLLFSLISHLLYSVT